MQIGEVEKQANLFSVLADTTRLKLLRLLSKQRETKALCVNALAYQLGVTQAAVSQHLRILKSVDLVRGERRGYRIHYFLNEEALLQAQQKLSEVLKIQKSIE